MTDSQYLNNLKTIINIIKINDDIMERNFKLIFKGLLSTFIGIITLILTNLSLKLTSNFKLAMLNIIKFDLPFFLMSIPLIFILNRTSPLHYCFIPKLGDGSLEIEIYNT